MKTTARSEWSKLENKRRGLMSRGERYANFTLPRLLTPEQWDENSDELSHDWQAVGAQAVNHVVNKLVLSLFAPSRPFMRLEADAKWKQEAIQQGVTEGLIDDALAGAERAAVKELDSRGTTRPQLYQAIANLVVLGNVVKYLPKDSKEDICIYNLRQYVVRRTGNGKVKVLLIRECLAFDELEEDVQAAVIAGPSKSRYRHDTKVEYFRWLVLNGKGGYDMTQWVDDTKLPEKFDGAWKEEDCPYRVLTWNLKNGNHYGTGLVEDYAGDFSGLSSLSEAQIKGAILSSEFRWMVNPAGMTKVEDLENSENGAALPGMPEDVALIANSKSQDLAVVQNIGQEYIQRIGRGFLMGSAVTRNAERVTAEEIRMQATELETSFGGTYSRLAVEMQLPMARWLLRAVSMDLKNTKLKLSIVTGLDALSRSGDLDNLRAALQDVGLLANLQQLVPSLKVSEIISTIFVGHGLPAAKYVKDEATMQKEAQAAQAAQAQTNMNEQAVSAGVEAGVNQGQ